MWKFLERKKDFLSMFLIKIAPYAEQSVVCVFFFIWNLKYLIGSKCLTHQIGIKWIGNIIWTSNRVRGVGFSLQKIEYT